MRTVGSALFAFLALVLTAVALPSAWIAANVVSEEGFVELASPLGTNAAFQEAMTSELAAELAAGTDLPGPLTDIIQPLLLGAAAQVTESPGYAAAWDETLRRSHMLNFGDPETLPAGTDSSSLTLDLAPIVGLAAREAGTAVGVDVPAPEQTPVSIGTADQRMTLERVETVAALWPGAAALAVVAAVISLLVARRRSTTLALLGLGTVVLGAVAWALIQALPGAVSGIPDANPIAGLFKDGLAARSADSMEPGSLAVAGAGMLLLIIGMVVRLLTGSRRR